MIDRENRREAIREAIFVNIYEETEERSASVHTLMILMNEDSRKTNRGRDSRKEKFEGIVVQARNVKNVQRLSDACRFSCL